MTDPVDPFKPGVLPVADIPVHVLEHPVALVPEPFEGARAEEQPVDHADAVAPLEELAAEFQADIAAAAGNENVHPGPFAPPAA